MGSVKDSGGIRLSECEPTDWYVVFYEKSAKWWIRWLACGRFKHVSVFGEVKRAGAWVFYDFQLHRAKIYLVADHEADILLAHYASGNTIVRMAQRVGEEFDMNVRLGSWCVPAVAHILGLRTCALRPDALYRQCLANGGEIIGSANDTQS